MRSGGCRPKRLVEVAAVGRGGCGCDVREWAAVADVEIGCVVMPVERVWGRLSFSRARALAGGQAVNQAVLGGVCGWCVQRLEGRCRKKVASS